MVSMRAAKMGVAPLAEGGNSPEIRLRLGVVVLRIDGAQFMLPAQAPNVQLRGACALAEVQTRPQSRHA